ncbi:hypothetical protein PCANC_27435 [Puccinia coronata f. sp. avenae]|uniref:Uncharacterized protein n=1 Tax=Puccinia coronata f. sp. avenae TaxID=200324 RepID=A0A2N5U8J7_9BASI|nr:hypothetical protein PCANC_27435 [Puccinia coronata f. sp. avenae]
MVEVQINKAAAKKAKSSAARNNTSPEIVTGVSEKRNVDMTDSSRNNQPPAEETLDDMGDGASVDDAEFLESLKAGPAEVLFPKASKTASARWQQKLARQATQYLQTPCSKALLDPYPALGQSLKIPHYKNIRKLRGPLPLTIFNKKWQQKAITQHLERQTRESTTTSETTVSYKGFPFVPEWDMNCAAWTNNHCGFYNTLLNVYGNHKFADMLKRHEEYCDNLIDIHGFMVAFRYDLLMRTHTFSFRLGSKRQVIADILEKRKDFVEECPQTVRNFREIDWEENLYAPGLAFSGMDPLTGQPKLKTPYQTMISHYPQQYFPPSTSYAQPYHTPSAQFTHPTPDTSYSRRQEYGHNPHYSGTAYDAGSFIHQPSNGWGFEQTPPKGLYRLQTPAARSVAATNVTSVYQTDVTSAAPTNTLCLCSNVSVGPADIKSVWATDVTSVASGRRYRGGL